MTLQDILREYSEDSIIDAGGVEWDGYSLEQKYIDQNKDILSREAIVGENGRIWLISEDNIKEEIEYTINF